jgi:peroxiredoxin
MRKTVYWLLPLVVLSISVAGYSQLQVPGADNTPKIGEKPPDFELSQGRGGTLGMKDFTGKKKVLLAFFPMAFTAG